MANWIFVDLRPFVDKVTPVLEKLSVYHSCSDHIEFATRQRSSSPQIVFLNGNNGESYLKAQINQTHKEDLVYLVIDSLSLSNEMEGELNRFLLNSNRVKGVINGNQGMGFVLSELNGIKEVSDMLFELDTDRDYFEDFEQRLEEIAKDASVQLKRVKKLHHSLVVPRELQFGKLRTTCKYAAGDSEHSEFWDISRTKKHQLTLLISTENSQQLTRVLDRILLFLDQKEYEKGGLKEFYQYLKQTLDQHFSLFLMLTEIEDMNSLLIIDGSFHFFINGIQVDLLEEGQVNKMQLRSGDRALIISEGMIKNYQKDFKENDLLKMLEQKWQLPVHEFTHQVFLGAKLNKEGRFHYYDSTSIILEVMR